MATVVTTNLRAAQKRLNYTRLKSPAPAAVGSATIVGTGPNTFSITSIVKQTGSTYRVTTSATHTFLLAETVTLAGTTNFNRAYVITAVPTGVTFEFTHINATDANEGAAGTSTVAKARSSTIAIVDETCTVTSTAHGFANAATVTISGAAQATLNGAKTVANTAANTWEFTTAALDTKAELLAALSTAILTDVGKVVSVTKIATTTYEVVLSKAHTNVVGDSVTLAATVNFNGAKTITSVTSPFAWRFTHVNSTDANETPAAGTASFTAASAFDVSTGVANESVFLVTKTSPAATGGFQEVDLANSAVANQPTGLVPATTYTVTVTVNGAGNAVSILGSNAQTYTTLISEINLDLTGATAALLNGNIRITSTTTGALTSIAITADTLFKALMPINSNPRIIKPAVAGTAPGRYVKVNTNTAGKIITNTYADWNAGTNVGTGEIVAARQTVVLKGDTSGIFVTVDRSPNATRAIVIHS